MTKIFKVIPIEDYGVIVDDSIKGEKYTWVYNTKTNRVYKLSPIDILDITSEKVIIAFIGKRLDGVPLIELATEEDTVYTEKQAYTIWKAGQEYWKTSGASVTFEKLTEGYKANTNKYSEEDMTNAHMTGSISALNWKTANIEEGYNHLNRAEEYVQSLHKQTIPTEIELEMEIVRHPDEEKLGVRMKYKKEVAKIHNKETNTITAVSYK